MNIPHDELIVALKENTSTLSNWGFCLSCGNQQDGCEPDARNYPCDECNTYQVFSAEEILMMGAYQ